MRLFRFISLLAILYFGSAISSFALDDIPEYDMKAVYLYNFSLFTEWPDNGQNNTTICLSHNSPLKSSIHAITLKPVKKGVIHVRLINDSLNLSNCHVVFIDETDPERVQQIAKKAQQLSVLSVSDQPDSLANGVMMYLFQDNNRLAFSINRDAINQTQLSLSSKLFSLAHSVYPPTGTSR